MLSVVRCLLFVICVPTVGPGEDSGRSTLCGVGVSLERAGQSTVITQIIDGSPAADAKMESGSLLIAVDGRPMRGVSVEEVVKHIAGPEGTAVELRICDPDGKTREVRLVRRRFTMSGRYNRGVRIDCILASPDLAERCTRARVVNDGELDEWSDHYPVAADFAFPPSRDASSKGTFRVITYNVLEGFRKRPERRKAIGQWLKEQKPAVVAFQELNGFTKQDLQAWAETWGHKHVRILKNKGYSTGLTSSAPILDVHKEFDGYWHGLLHGETHGVRFFVVHMAPGAAREKNRLQEANRLLKLAGPAEKAKIPTVFLGDFNATSAYDKAYYLHVGLSPDAVQPYAMDAFLKAGYVDLVAENRPDANAPIISIPTPLGLAIAAEEEAKRPSDKKD